MGSLTALVLATPLFGFSLTVDADLAPPVSLVPQVAVSAGADAGADGAEAPADSEDGQVDGQVDDQASGEAGGEPTVAELMQLRGERAGVHRALGIATWASMTVTMVLGSIQYRNLYGFFDSQSSNPCVQGDAIFGQGQCTGVPWPHLSSALITSGLYFATFGISLRMPDPMGLSEGDGDYAKNLRLHKALRWIHFGGMLSQILFGIVVGNGERFGLDRANDYNTLRSLATVHMAMGWVTYGALTAAGAIMVF